MDARLEVYNDKMAKALSHLEGDYQTIRAGREDLEADKPVSYPLVTGQQISWQN